MPKTSPTLAAVLPPLIFGTATFNTQYNRDPFALPARELVGRALSLGVRAFDTSPYYGPSEEILGRALDAEDLRAHWRRSEYYLLTKVGRVGPAEFDYSPAWVRTSVARSLARLRTDYVDVVYCHDVEFVTPAEVLAAVVELRRIRDETRTLRYVGISGYPVATLCDLAELVLRATGEPLDAVMSYANYTLQNQQLLTAGRSRLAAAGVSVVPNASILGMGLLRREGLPVGAQGDWHPAPAGLRAAVGAANAYLDQHDERLEKMAIRFAVEGWIRDGAALGSCGDPASGIPWQPVLQDPEGQIRSRSPRLGVSVMGVSSVAELDETMRVWRSILDTLARDDVPVETEQERVWGVQRRLTVQRLAAGVREVLGAWADVAWPSPPPGFVNQARTLPRAASEGESLGESDDDWTGALQPAAGVPTASNNMGAKADRASLVVQLPTPAASPGHVSADE